MSLPVKYAKMNQILLTGPNKRWEFDMENSNMRGHWSGIFTQQGNQTEIEFTEDVAAKKIFMKPFIKTYLKKQQTQFISDLENELKRRQNNDH